MRLVLTLLAALTLALAGCGGTTDTADSPAPDDGTTAPADTSQPPDDSTDTDDTPDDAGDVDASDDDGDDASTDDDAADDDVAAEGDCSAFGLEASVEGAERLSEEARATAEFLLDAAVRCDEQLLFTAAEESDTSFFFGSATVDEVLALPEDPDADPSAWEALARLLGDTTPVIGDGDIWTWPAAAAAGADDTAWEELVDSGLYTQAQVDELRGAGEGYLGWRVGIETDGTWLFLTAGD